MREAIYEQIKVWLRSEKGIPEVLPFHFVVERPDSFERGDYTTNTALVAAPFLKEKPQQLAVELKEYLENKIEGVKEIKIAGPGFINFHLTYKALTPKKWPLPQVSMGKVALVEYTSPNLFKPLHIGNLVGNIIGESIARMLESTGAEVKHLNYPSDIGLTVAKGVWGLVTTKGNPENIADLGKAYQVGNAAYEDGSAKDEIDAVNVALYEDSNSEWSTLRKKGIETSRKHLDELCKKLGTTFDAEFFESEAGPLGRDIVRTNIGKVFEESEGAVVYHGAHTRVFLNSKGLPTYEAKEVGLFDLKSKAYPNFDISLTITGNEQKDFFAVVFDAIQKVFPDCTNGKILKHVPTGFLRLTTGKMSSRTGNVITGESLLEDTTKAARDREDVAVGALKYTVLKSTIGRDIVFDPEKSLSLEGDSGPYMQYALVRARALLRKAAEAQRVESMKVDDDRDFKEVGTMYHLLQILIHFPEVIERAASDMEPHHVATYLMEVSSAFNSWYATERVIVENKILSDRIELIEAVEYTLAKGLYLLGIPAPEEM